MTTNNHKPVLKQGFLILDFGSQYTWLIARSFREMGFYTQVEPFDFPLQKIQALQPAGLVLSGGPASVLSSSAPTRNLKQLLEIAPLLGICYGLQLLCHQWGGKIIRRGKGTLGGAYGLRVIHWNTKKILAQDFQKVWMSHGDLLVSTPKEFDVLAQTAQKAPAVLMAPNILALQFHPEVAHTEGGKNILTYFAKNMCGLQKGTWTAGALSSFIESQVEKTWTGLEQKQKKASLLTKELAPLEGQILCALSGGVDSTVMACLLTKMLGPKRIHCVFVDTGLLRKNEYQEVLSAYKRMALNVRGLLAKEPFLSALKGIEEPEKKRKTIGRVFIDIFKEYKNKHPGIKYLAQGTLYPDVIESAGTKGAGVTIKSHHNVGGLPKDIPFTLIEPLRLLFKDEVRVLGRQLKVPEPLLLRHPFPGPGLAVRIGGPINKDRLHKVREADAIFIEELKKAQLYHKIWQAFAVLLPVRSVGVQGDQRTYEEAIALRAITSRDGMTADWFAFSPSFLHKVSDRVTNEVEGINRVVYDITSKPPGTIEWL